MAHPYHHALASVKKWGGEVSDYIELHSWFDQSKSIAGDFRHRALRHHAEGIFMLVIWTDNHRSTFSLTKGEHRAACPISRFRAYWNQRPRPTRSASVWIFAAGGNAPFPISGF
jgi:hypothetical protein